MRSSGPCCMTVPFVPSSRRTMRCPKTSSEGDVIVPRLGEHDRFSQALRRRRSGHVVGSLHQGGADVAELAGLQVEAFPAFAAGRGLLRGPAPGTVGRLPVQAQRVRRLVLVRAALEAQLFLLVAEGAIEPGEDVWVFECHRAAVASAKITSSL